MKKSDLTRRAFNFASRKWREFPWLESHRVCARVGFEAGYLSARADLRRHLVVMTPRRADESLVLRILFKWLRPIR